jgi:hypothetical protein
MIQNKLTLVPFTFFLVTASPGMAEDWRTIPIADVHMHVYHKGRESTDSETLIKKAKDNNVRWAGGVGDGDWPEMREAFGKRYISAFGQHEWTKVWIDGGNPALLEVSNFDGFFEEFQNGKYDGIGEIHTNSLGKNPRDTPIDGPMMIKMYEYLNRKGGWIQIHHSTKRAPVDDLIKTINRFPRVKFVLSHCAFDARAKAMRRIFSETENGYCEVSGTGPSGAPDRLRDRKLIYGPRHNGLRPSWKQLIKDFPNRVMVGSDTCCGDDKHYDGIISNLREWVLADLEEPIRSQVAYKNAVKVFNLLE